MVTVNKKKEEKKIEKVSAPKLRLDVFGSSLQVNKYNFFKSRFDLKDDSLITKEEFEAKYIEMFGKLEYGR
jgi:hypothetical protein